MGKKYCAMNTKYYKNSNVGEIDHVLRNMAINVNSIESLTKNNFGFCFGDSDLKTHYKNKLDQAKKANKLALQSNSNTFIDSVLIFDSVQFEKCLNDGKKDEVEQATKDFMQEYKNLYGFEPIGFEFHLDEGTKIDFDTYEKLDIEEQKKYVAVENDNEAFTTEYIKRNIHAHAIFLNYDFQKNKSCLRNMRKKDWENSQDLLHKYFEKFGFDRGEKKKTSKKDHKNKAEFVRELALKNNELVENHSKNLQEKNYLLDQIIDHQNDLNRFDDLALYAEKIKKFIFSFKEKNPKLISKLLAMPRAEQFKDMALSIYDALTKKTDIAPILIEEIKPLKNDEIQKIEVDVEAKKKRIKKINNRRKYSNKPRPNKDI
ncbi:hypothetical protein ESZ36_19460 [Colwellia demingiae]|uniref:Uncharacterized protein n=1 Tax=Colwellia demingiae TaxID=89401 RepID=A0A5C6Q899_9GAMM|nr:hypothetical protein [Colwellia demingiae]TWX64870.1 hypothetical protein ESZ36_19460 [Colwellia demingiae]